MTDQEKLQELERRLLKIGLRAQKAEDDCSRQVCNSWNDDEQKERYAGWMETAKAEASLCREMLAIIWGAICPTCGDAETYCFYLNEQHGERTASMKCQKNIPGA